ncbi:DUF1697 domain-containing protein [Nocardioides daejeonensis]|uniref:DUF1697 domain-containing protein n=1 Tax=Nocardioides daejeonensis TaxID=1046556 RepID=UPI000D750448|nr:DUF1697 domain-containing protein [Nocardioides daejeonensis]
MATHLAFLRAINLGAKRKFPKEEIKGSVEAAGFTDVATYINTGNVRFETRMRSRDRIEQALERSFLANRGFEVPTIVFSRAEFAAVGADAQELHDDGLARHYVWLLRDEPSSAVRAQIEELSDERNKLIVRNRAVHLLMSDLVQGVVDPLRAERLLGVTTNRNYNVVSTLAREWC